MWLLNTTTAVLQYFPSPEDVPGGYAILSHLWDPSEDNFQNMMRLRDDHKAGLLPPDPLSRVMPKTKKCCELANLQGYQYIWIDTCCGDRSHTAALSTDVQSQFLYYSLAQVCFVYLRDVPSGADLRAPNSAFRASKWHTYPWSLQELIAPDLVIFYSKDWEVLGTKQTLAPLLEEIFGIPATVLTFDEEATSFSVAARMLWASHQEPNIARLEEQAHSLLGIMGVQMDLLPSGEGRRAFQRLQVEIIKQLADTTVFVWGDQDVLTFAEVAERVQHLPPLLASHSDSDHPNEAFLFAPTPSAFKSAFATARSMPHLPIGNTAYTLDTSKLLTFEVKPNGILAHLPVLELSQQRILIAFISCSMAGKPLGLVLEWCPNSSGSGVPLYDVGLKYESKIFRLVTLDAVTGLKGAGWEGRSAEDPTFIWRTIYIRGQHAHDPSQRFQRIPMNRDLSSFFIQCTLLERFSGRCLPNQPVVSTQHIAWDSRQDSLLALQPASSPHLSVQDRPSGVPPRPEEPLSRTTPRASLPATFLFFIKQEPRLSLPFLVHFGTCIDTEMSRGDSEFGTYWAKMERYNGHTDFERVEFQPGIPEHDCSTDHIAGWTTKQKTFSLSFLEDPLRTYGLRLSFRLSEAFGTSHKVLVPDIETVYMR